jgi:hypothetical protein
MVLETVGAANLLPLGEGAYYLIALHYLGDRDVTTQGGRQRLRNGVSHAVESLAWAATTPGFYPLLKRLVGE